MTCPKSYFPIKPSCLFCLFLLSLVFGCSSDESFTPSPSILISGNQYSGFLESRTSSATLPAGSRLSLFSTGGMEADNVLMTYNGTFWEGELPDVWNENGNAAELTVYTPYIDTDPQLFYDGKGQLQDILYDRQSCRKGDRINLTFKHLFACITFHVAAGINQTLQNITFRPSVLITGLNHRTGALSMETAENPQSVTLDKADDGNYSLIIPPSEHLKIDICIQTTDGKSYETFMPESHFAAGTSYSCRILSNADTQGIHTAADFIAFTHLINGEAYEGRSLDEFRTEENGRNIYRLCADIEFTPEECSQLMEIGIYHNSYSERTNFNDIFDGQGHTLTNLTLQTPENRIRYGLFGYIEEKGIIRNLHIRNSTLTVNQATEAGILAGVNFGIITDCSVKNSQIIGTSLAKEKYVGGLLANNSGYVTNCAAENILIESSVSYVGGLIGINQKYLLNSYAANCDLRSKTQGMLCYSCNSGQIHNCYTSGVPANCYSLCYTAINTFKVYYCYYPQNTIWRKNDKPTSNVKAIEAINFEDPSSQEYLITKLNNWIPEQGASLFPKLDFQSWQSNDSPPAVLVISGTKH